MRAVAIGLVAAALLSARGAHADGAFADSQRLFLPPERPDQMVLATNFGLVVSDDGGQSWSWACCSFGGRGASATLLVLLLPWAGRRRRRCANLAGDGESDR